MAFLQWWYNTIEAQNIKQSAKEEIMNEINKKLKVSDISLVGKELEKINENSKISQLAIAELSQFSDKSVRLSFIALVNALAPVLIKSGIFFQAFNEFMRTDFDNDMLYYKLEFYVDLIHTLPISYPTSLEEIKYIENSLVVLNKTKEHKYVKKSQSKIIQIETIYNQLSEYLYVSE